jgi:flagellar biogenesis protein FliO
VEADGAPAQVQKVTRTQQLGLLILLLAFIVYVVVRVQ